METGEFGTRLLAAEKRISVLEAALKNWRAFGMVTFLAENGVQPAWKVDDFVMRVELHFLDGTADQPLQRRKGASK